MVFLRTSSTKDTFGRRSETSESEEDEDVDDDDELPTQRR